MSDQEARKYTEPKKRYSLTMDPAASESGKERAQELGYSSFSEYVEHLIRADIEERKVHTVTRSEAGVSYAAQSTGGADSSPAKQEAN